MPFLLPPPPSYQQFLVKSDAETLAETGVALLALYYLTPYALAAAATSIRGYAGSLNPPSTLDMLLQVRSRAPLRLGYQDT